jgi:membrane associated rhomboid family serine protease
MSQPPPSQHAHRTTAFPPVVKALLIANVAIFALQMAGWFAPLVRWFALWPLGMPEAAEIGGQLVRVPQFHLWQIVTYGFLHGGIGHLFFNLLALWMFGVHIERLWGSRRFAVYYLVCVCGAAIVQLAVLSMHSGSYAPTLGASGGVFGILLAFGMMFPNHIVRLLIPPIPLKAKYFVILYGALELAFGVTGAVSGVAHFAHLGGMLFGFILITYWRRPA